MSSCSYPSPLFSLPPPPLPQVTDAASKLLPADDSAASKSPPTDECTTLTILPHPKKASTSTALVALQSLSVKRTTTNLLVISSASFIQYNLLFVLLLTVLLHEFAVVTSTVGSGGQDIRYMFLSELTEPDMALVGESFYASAFANSSPAASVDELILQFRCLQELDELCPAFRPLLYNIALVIFFQKSSFGANFRLYFGSGLSVGDMVTDIIMICTYIQADNWGFAKTMIIMLSLNMLTQIALVIIQNLKNG